MQPSAHLCLNLNDALQTSIIKLLIIHVEIQQK